MDTPWKVYTYKLLDLLGLLNWQDMPQKFNEWLPKLKGNIFISSREHVELFPNALDNNQLDYHEGVVLRYFAKCLEEDARLWFKIF